MLEIKEMLAPSGSKCRPGNILNPEYITVHNTANTNVNSGAVTHGKYLQGGGKSKSVSWHFAVDDIAIIRCIPENENAWHAGDGGNGTGNRKSLAIEICENPESNLLTATNNAAELVAFLMHKYNIPIEKVVQHNHWSGKNCPRRIRAGEPYNWDVFIGNVISFFNEQNASQPIVEPVTPIPAPIIEPEVSYQVYGGSKWWGWVTGYNEVNGNGFAGVENNLISGIRAKLSAGSIRYRVHTINGKWWGWITDYNLDNSNGYAGVLGKSIDMIQMELVGLPGYAVEYRVSTNRSGSYLDWVRNYNTINGNGYAGIKGVAIDKLQIRIVKV